MASVNIIMNYKKVGINKGGTMKDKWIKIGEVGVDSGNLMICDPCYIDRDWQKKEYEDVRLYMDKKTGKIYQYGIHFFNYEEKLPELDNMTPNELQEKKMWEELEYKVTNEEFSYNSITHSGSKMYKRIKIKDSSWGDTAVAFHSGLGDGVYEVFAKIGTVKDWGERIKEVRIKLV